MIENDLSGEYEIVGSAPDVTVRQDNNYFINVCYYSPVNYGLCVSIQKPLVVIAFRLYKPLE